MISIAADLVARKGIFFLLLIGNLVFVAKPTANAQASASHAAVATSVESASEALPQFEVATIKPIDLRPGVMHTLGVNVYPGGRVVIQGFTLKNLICTAFNLSYWQISGGDDWLAQKRFDIEAKPPETPQSNTLNIRHSSFGIEDEHLRQMLQALLIDRFQLKFHRETKTGAVYLLEKSGKTLKLKPTKITSSHYPSGEIGAVGGRGLLLHDTSMSELAKALSAGILHRPVLDKTELDGPFDFESKDILTNSDIRSNNLIDFYLRAIKEMGLKLQPAKGPVETFVINHAEAPSAN